MVEEGRQRSVRGGAYKGQGEERWLAGEDKEAKGQGKGRWSAEEDEKAQGGQQEQEEEEEGRELEGSGKRKRGLCERGGQVVQREGGGSKRRREDGEVRGASAAHRRFAETLGTNAPAEGGQAPTQGPVPDTVAAAAAAGGAQEMVCEVQLSSAGLPAGALADKAADRRALARLFTQGVEEGLNGAALEGGAGVGPDSAAVAGGKSVDAVSTEAGGSAHVAAVLRGPDATIEAPGLHQGVGEKEEAGWDTKSASMLGWESQEGGGDLSQSVLKEEESECAWDGLSVEQKEELLDMEETGWCAVSELNDGGEKQLASLVSPWKGHAPEGKAWYQEEGMKGSAVQGGSAQGCKAWGQEEGIAVKEGYAPECTAWAQEEVLKGSVVEEGHELGPKGHGQGEGQGREDGQVEGQPGAGGKVDGQLQEALSGGMVHTSLGSMPLTDVVSALLETLSSALPIDKGLAALLSGDLASAGHGGEAGLAGQGRETDMRGKGGESCPAGQGRELGRAGKGGEAAGAWTGAAEEGTMAGPGTASRLTAAAEPVEGAKPTANKVPVSAFQLTAVAEPDLAAKLTEVMPAEAAPPSRPDAGPLRRYASDPVPKCGGSDAVAPPAVGAGARPQAKHFVAVLPPLVRQASDPAPSPLSSPAAKPPRPRKRPAEAMYGAAPGAAAGAEATGAAAGGTTGAWGAGPGMSADPPNSRPTSRDASPDGGSTGAGSGVSGAELLRQFQALDGLRARLEAQKDRCSRLPAQALRGSAAFSALARVFDGVGEDCSEVRLELGKLCPGPPLAQWLEQAAASSGVGAAGAASSGAGAAAGGAGAESALRFSFVGPLPAPGEAAQTSVGQSVYRSVEPPPQQGVSILAGLPLSGAAAQALASALDCAFDQHASTWQAGSGLQAGLEPEPGLGAGLGSGLGLRPGSPGSARSDIGVAGPGGRQVEVQGDAGAMVERQLRAEVCAIRSAGSGSPVPCVAGLGCGAGGLVRSGLLQLGVYLGTAPGQAPGQADGQGQGQGQGVSLGLIASQLVLARAPEPLPLYSLTAWRSHDGGSAAAPAAPADGGGGDQSSRASSPAPFSGIAAAAPQPGGPAAPPPRPPAATAAPPKCLWLQQTWRVGAWSIQLHFNPVKSFRRFFLSVACDAEAVRKLRSAQAPGAGAGIAAAHALHIVHALLSLLLAAEAEAGTAEAAAAAAADEQAGAQHSGGGGGGGGGVQGGDAGGAAAQPSGGCTAACLQAAGEAVQCLLACGQLMYVHRQLGLLLCVGRRGQGGDGRGSSRGRNAAGGSPGQQPRQSAAGSPSPSMEHQWSQRQEALHCNQAGGAPDGEGGQQHCQKAAGSPRPRGVREEEWQRTAAPLAGSSKPREQLQQQQPQHHHHHRKAGSGPRDERQQQQHHHHRKAGSGSPRLREEDQQQQQRQGRSKQRRVAAPQDAAGDHVWSLTPTVPMVRQ